MGKPHHLEVRCLAQRIVIKYESHQTRLYLDQLYVRHLPGILARVFVYQASTMTSSILFAICQSSSCEKSPVNAE